MKAGTLIITLALALAFMLPGPKAQAGLDININIDIMPLKVKSDPVVVPIFGTMVYLMTGTPMGENVLFFGGFWYRESGGKWYKSNDVKGNKWGHVPPGHVPKEIRGLPSGYKKVSADQPRIKNTELKQNWKNWEKEKRWEKKGKKKTSVGDVNNAYQKGKDAKKLNDKMKGKKKKGKYF